MPQVSKWDASERLDEIIQIIQEAWGLTRELSKDLLATGNPTIEEFEHAAGIGRSAGELASALRRMTEARYIWIDEWFDQIAPADTDKSPDNLDEPEAV